MDFDLSSLSDPRDFPARFSYLRDVDRELRCVICAEFIDSAVTLPCCGVAYCSLCLRSALAAGEAICPNHLCRKPSSEASIRPISSINRIVASWKAGRAELLAISRAAESTKSACENSQETRTEALSAKQPEKPAKSSRSAKSATGDASTTKSEISSTVPQPVMEIGNLVAKPNPVQSLSLSADSHCNIAASPAPFLPRTQSPSSLSRTTSIDDIIEEKSPPLSNQSAICSSPDGDRCIVCNAKISPARMARHVEMHFAAEDRETRKRENEKSAESKARVSIGSKTDRKPLPKLNYHIMQIKEIKSRCDALKLSTVGRKDKLIQRHRSYTLLFNANVDSVNPKTEQQLRAEVMRRERVSEGGGGVADFETSGSQAPLFSSARDAQSEDNAVGQKINKKSKPEVVEKVMKDYETSHRDQFSDLIARAKMSREGAKGKQEKADETNDESKGAAVKSNNYRFFRTKSEMSNLKQKTNHSKDHVRIIESEESAEVKSFWAEWEAERIVHNEDIRSRLDSEDNHESESTIESIESQEGGIQQSRPSSTAPSTSQPRSSSAAASSSPFPAEQTPFESREEIVTPSSAGDDQEGSQDQDDVLSIVSHHAVTLTLSQSTPSPLKDTDTDSGLARIPPENEKDNYEEDAETQIEDEGRNLVNAQSEFHFQKPNATRVKRPSHGNKRSLSPLMVSTYFAASPSKRPRTTDNLTTLTLAATTTATTATTTETTATTAIPLTNSSPDIDSQMSYAVAQDVFVGDDRGSPILFPSNENSLDGAEDHNSSMSPVIQAPPSLELPFATQHTNLNFRDKPQVDINSNTAKISMGMDTDEEEDVVCLDQDEDSTKPSDTSKSVLRLSKGSSFLHHSKSDKSSGRNGKVENIEIPSATSEPSSYTAAAALSPPTSTVKSKPRIRKKVVPFMP